MTICPWRINWSTETSRELSDSGSIKKREREYFSQGIYGGEKCFVVVAGGRFIGPKSATPLASCLHGRQGLFPFPITAFPSRFLIRLRFEDFDMFSYYQRKFTKYNFMLIESSLIFLPYIGRGTVNTVHYALIFFESHCSVTPILRIFTNAFSQSLKPCPEPCQLQLFLSPL